MFANCRQNLPGQVSLPIGHPQGLQAVPAIQASPASLRRRNPGALRLFPLLTVSLPTEGSHFIAYSATPWEVLPR